MKKMKIFILAAALAVCGLMTLAACETPDDTVHTHSFGEWEVVTEPTCTEEGKLERTCSCGEKETSSISALGHGKEMTVRENEVAATCTEQGSYEDVVYCTVCEEEMSRKTVEIPAAGHKPGAAASCINAQVCTVCGTVLAPMLAHTPGAPVRADEKPATCTEGGSYEEVTSCTVCGTELSRKIVETLALGHDYVNGVCTRCHDVLVTEGLKFQLSADGKSYVVSDYVGYSAEVYIPSAYEGLPVESIGNRAFEGSERMMRIVLPDTITSIGNSAFSGCLYLEEITLPDGVAFIGDRVFSDTAYYNDKSNWEDGVLYIGNHLIKAEENISGNYSIREGTKTIAGEAFSYCSGLRSIVIPDSVTSIGNSAFYGCSRLTSVVIPDGVTTIGEYTFVNCSRLTSVVIPDSVTEIGGFAFTGCSSLTSITIPDSVTSIGESAFWGTAYYGECSHPTTNDFGACTECNVIVDWTKYEAKLDGLITPNVTDLTASLNDLKSQVSDVASDVDSVITKIGDINLGADITTIVDTVNNIRDEIVALLGAEEVTDKATPATITGIAKAIDNLQNSINFVQESISGVENDKTNWENGVLYIGNHLIRAEENISGNYFIREGTKTIADGAFRDCGRLTSVVIPDSVTFIGENAFLGCSELMIYTVFLEQPDGWVYGWNGDATVAWAWDGEAVIYHFESDGGSAIEDISSAMAIVLPIPQREGYLFAGWYENAELSGAALQSPYYHQGGATLYARWIFLEGLEQSVGLEIEDGYIVGIGSCTDTVLVLNMPVAEGAFIGCHTITKVFFGPGVTSIGYQAFGNSSIGCGKLTEVVFSTAVPPEIGSDVFGSTWNRADFTVYVPEGSLAAYEAVDDRYWQMYLVDAGKIEEM